MHSLRSVFRLSVARLSFTLLAAIAGCLSASAENGLSSEPYVVYVAQEGAYARCGPSGEYYRTDPLVHGQALDVYAETDDGWLGIRPPEDSFCWIVAETIEPDASQEHGTVIEDRTVAWIGTHLGRAREYRWQVQLAKGEPVSIIGRSEREGPDGPQLWYRIVPPSGEFRWVHRDQVVLSSQELVASANRNVASGENEFLAGDQTASQPQTTSMAAARASEDRSSSSSPRSSRRNGATPQAQANLDPLEPAIGSGLNDNWRAGGDRDIADDSLSTTLPNKKPSSLKEAVTQNGLLASMEFLGRPRLLDIGADATAPNGSESAGDENWVTGVSRSMRGRPRRFSHPNRSRQALAIVPFSRSLLRNRSIRLDH